MFSDPEVATVGLTQQQAEEQGRSVTTAEVNLAEAIARPYTYEKDPRGHLAVLADRDAGVLLGAWAVGPQASEWIHRRAGSPRVDPGRAACWTSWRSSPPTTRAGTPRYASSTSADNP